MNKKLNHNFSLRKLLLSALVAGPLAVLPAPLWALPDTAVTNLTASSGVSLSGVLNGGAGALNVTAADKSILTWQSFNVTAADTINYLLPSATSSVLNNVTGGASTIAGALNSNGNVYLLNPAGIVISKTAQINTGGFYASTVSEPSSFFGTTGSLNFTGSASADVVVESDGSAAATIQAVGTGNNILLAGKSVLVEGANFYGNVKLQSSSTGSVTLAQTRDAVLLPNNGGSVLVNKANGAGGNLTIVSNGGAVSLTGTPVAVVPTVTVNPNGTLSIANPVAAVGSGYAPNAQVALSITAPLIRQSLNSTTTASTNVGTTAAGYATTNAAGQITGYVLTNAGAGYISTTNGALVGSAVTATPAQVGFATTVAGTTSIDTSGATNGAVTQTFGRFTATGGTSITTGTVAAGSAAAVTLSNADLSSITLPVAGSVSILEVNGFTVGNSKILPASNTALSLRATSGSVTMVSGAKVEVVPSVAAPDPSISLIANAGGVTYSGIGSLKIGTLTTTTASAGVADITATGNITIPGYSNPTLRLTTAGGDITTGSLSSTAGAANQVSATLTASGNIYVGGNINTTGKVVANAGGTLSILGSNTALMTAGSGLDLKAVGNIDFINPTTGVVTNPRAGIATGTDAKIESTAGNVTIPGGFSGGGTITAANNVTIGTSIGATPSISATNALDGTSTTYKLTGGTISNGAGLYTPNSTVPVVVTAAGSAALPTAYANTNASGQITSVVVTSPGRGVVQSNGTVALSLAVAAPTNAIVAGGALAIKATGGSVTIGNAIVGTGNVSVTSAGSIAVPSVTAPNLTLVSTSGAVSQSVGSTIMSTGTTTVNAATSASLENATNDFGTVVVLNSPSGASLKDTNAITLGNSTDAKGSVSLSSGAGLTALASGQLTLTSPAVAATAGAATVSAGSVTAVTLTTTGTGYTPSSQIPVTFSAPPAATTLLTNTMFNAASAGQNSNGWVIGAVGTEAAALQAVVVSVPVGNGYISGSEVPLTVAGTFTTAPTAVAVINGNGQIGSVKITSPGTGVTAITGITINTAAPIASVTATGNLVTNAAGQVTGISITDGGSGYLGSYAPTVSTIPAPTVGVAAKVTPTFTGSAVTAATIDVAGAGYVTAPTILAAGGLPAFTTALTNGVVTTITPVTTGGIALGAAATDVIKVAGNLTLTSTGPAGTVTNALTTLSTKYSELTTVANSVSVIGNVSLNTAGANATLGVPTPFGSTPTMTAAQVGGNVVGGTITVIQSNNLNLGAITAGALKATSIAGNITNSGKLAITGASDFTANSIFTPGTITLSDTTNSFGGAVSIINGKDVSIASSGATTNVTAGSATANGVISGSISVTAAGALNLGVAGNGNLTKVGFSAGGNVVITDGANTDGLTLENISNTAGTVGVTAGGPITLGSGIRLASTGLTTITSTGAGSSIKDSAANVSVYGPISLVSGNDISITQAGHSLGQVSLSSGNFGATATSSAISYTEAGTANLGNVAINGIVGSLSVTSSGSIQQAAGTTIVVPTAAGATNTVGFSALNGAVNLNNTGNNIAPAVAISAAGNSSITQTTAQSLVLGNVAVTAGTFAAKVTTVPAGLVTTDISQATGTTARVYGATTLTSSGGKITLANTGNNFGGLTVDATNAAATPVGAAVSIKENGTVNLLSVNTGNAATSSLTLTSENGAIIETATPLTIKGITVGGTTSLTALTDVTLSKTDIDNNFGGKAITVTAPGNVIIQDNNLTTIIAGGTTIGGTLSVKNTNAGGTIKDSTGDLKVGGNVTLDTKAAGAINITSSNASFGAVQFHSGAVTIYETTTLNLAAGSTAAGAAYLTSGGDIITSGLGGASFSGALSLNANGKIAITNPFYVSGGLTFRALGSVDLKTLSVTGNLNGITPVNLGSSSYTPPSP